MTLADRESQSLDSNAKGLRVIAGNTETASNGLNYGQERTMSLFGVKVGTSKDPIRTVVDLRSVRSSFIGGIARHAGLKIRSLTDVEGAVMSSDNRYEGHDLGLIPVAPSKRVGTQPGDFWIAYRGIDSMVNLASRKIT